MNEQSIYWEELIATEVIKYIIYTSMLNIIYFWLLYSSSTWDNLLRLWDKLNNLYAYEDQENISFLYRMDNCFLGGNDICGVRRVHAVLCANCFTSPYQAYDLKISTMQIINTTRWWRQVMIYCGADWCTW